MSVVKQFTFGPFAENTFVLIDETKECVIIDPGCYDASEEIELKNYIDQNRLTPKYLLCTHAHVDHISGNLFVYETYGLKPLLHKNDTPTLQNQQLACMIYGLTYKPSPLPDSFINEGDTIKYGNTSLQVLYTPGHAPGHIVFYNAKDKFVINGDVLFKGSIGRTDLPGGDFNTLEKSIKTRLYTLPEDTTVYCGHGPQTNIGHEKRTNPFVQG